MAPQQVVFIDSRVPDLQDLLAGLQPDEQAFVIDASSDGVAQIAGILAANDLTDLSAISIVGHGASGAIDVGATMLNDGDLSSHADALAQIGAALAPGGSLQLYACNTASGATGQQFIADLSSFTGGATVAASTQDIGQTATGANWTLDAIAGPAPAQVADPFTAAAEAKFSGTLTQPTTELWISGSAGGPQNIILHADDTGTGTASNVGTLFTPTSANNPSAGAGINGLDQLQLDTENQKYFIATQNTTATEVLEGSLSSALANPSGTPTYTTLFSAPTDNANGFALTGLAVDAPSQQVFFDDGHSFYKVGYAGGPVTTLGSTGSTPSDPFLDGLALDLPHHVAYFMSARSNITTSTTTGGSVHYNTNVTNAAIYQTSNLTASSSSVSISKLTDVDAATYGGIWDGNGQPGIAVDTNTGTVYFTTHSTNGAEGGVFALDPTTQQITTLFRQGSGGPTGTLTAIQVDDATGKYYVSVLNPGDNGGAIYVGNLSGGTPTLFETIPTFSGGTIDPIPNGFSLDNAPTLSGSPPNSTFTESNSNPASSNNTPVSVISTTVGDSDNDALIGATVTLGNRFAGDLLGVSTTGTSITASYNSSTGVLTLSGKDSVSHYQAVLDSVTYTSTSDNPTDYGSDTSRTVTWSVNDGLLTSAPQTATVSVVGVDDPPTLTGTVNASFTENGPAVTLSPAVTVSDPDSLTLAGATVAITGGTFAGDADVLAANVSGTSITASYNSATETLTLTGTDSFAHYQTVLDQVTFVTPSDNPTDFGSAPTRTVSWTLNDGGASSTVTSTVSITAVNDPPTLAGTANASYTENGPATTLSPAVTVSDPDSLTLAGATVAITGGTFAGDADVLAANVTGTAITASYNAATETLTLTGADSLAHYQQVLDSVTFATASDNPDNFGADPTRTVAWQLDDGSGSSNLSAVATTTIGITAVNDPPTLSGTADASFTENGPAVTLSPAAAVSDPDSTSLAGATVAITGGTFAGDADVLAANVTGTSITASYDSATETLTLTGSDTLAHYSQVLDSVTFSTPSDNPTDFGADPTRTVTWTLNDGSASNATSSVTTSVTINAVDDPPTLSGTANASFTEGGAPVTLSGSAAVSDPDNLTLAGATVALTAGTFAGDGDVLAANVTGTSITANYNSATETLTLSGSDTLAHYQQALDSVTFVTASHNPDDFGSAPTRTVTWTLNDGAAASSVTTTVSITAVDDPPTLSGTANASYTENGPAATLSPSAAVSDPDSLTLAGATVAITGGTFPADGDVLAANVSGTAITASYNAATETLTLSGADTLAHYSQVLDSVTFSTPSDNPDDYGSAPTRTVTWTVNDGSAATSATTTVSITAVNDPPTVSAATSAGYTEQAAATTLSGALAVSDPDSLTLAGATVAIAGGTFAGDGDVLAANVSGTAITASYNAASETLVLSGLDTLAHYQSVLDSVTFFDASDNPTNYGSNATRTITWVVTDGSAASALQTTTLNVTAVNDAPTLTGVPATASYRTGQTVTLAPHASVSDPDNLTLANATVQITGGTFVGDTDVLAASVSGTAITASYNAATETLTLTGADTLAHYQQVLDSVTFTSGLNPTNFGSNPTRTVTWTINDGSGSNNTATTTSTISVSNTLVKNDFNGDLKSDIVFQDGVGLLPPVQYLMNGTTVTAQATLPNPGLGWHIVGSGDFNNDGRADIVWQNANGTPMIWTMNGSTVTSQTTLSDPGITWKAIGTGDFNGDGQSDIVFQSSLGTPMIWTMNGTSVASTATLSNPGATWSLVGTGDFNGDGKSDLVFQQPNGTPMIWEMNGTSVIASATLPKPHGAGSWQLIGTGDFNGDGDADLLFQKSNGTPMIYTMNGTSIVSTATLANPGATWKAIGTGDYNGDGKSDILFQSNLGTPMIWEMNGTTVTASATLPNPGVLLHANTG
jgi:lipopolysaccharide export system protein LptA